jgi:hypothetical protein
VKERFSSYLQVDLSMTIKRDLQRRLVEPSTLPPITMALQHMPRGCNAESPPPVVDHEQKSIEEAVEKEQQQQQE